METITGSTCHGQSPTQLDGAPFLAKMGAKFFVCTLTTKIQASMQMKMMNLAQTAQRFRYSHCTTTWTELSGRSLTTPQPLDKFWQWTATSMQLASSLKKVYVLHKKIRPLNNHQLLKFGNKNTTLGTDTTIIQYFIYVSANCTVAFISNNLKWLRA